MSFVLVCIYIIMLHLQPQYWLFPAGTLPPGFIDILAIGIVVLLMLELLREKVTLPRLLPHPWLAVGFLGAALASDVMMSNFGNFSKTAIMMGKLVLTFMMILMVTNSPRRARSVMYLLIGTAFIISVHCLMQVYFDFGLGGQPPLYMQGFTRAQFFGIMNDPNDTAMFLIMTLPLVLILHQQTNPLVRVLEFVLMGLMLWAIYLTQSRGGFVALALVILTIVGQFFRRRNFIIAACICLTFLALFMPGRFAHIGMQQDNRVMLWGISNQVFKSRPLTGIGANRIAEYMPFSKVPHNSFVHTYSELGLLGYFFWLSLLVFSIIGCWRVRQMVPDDDDDRLLILEAKLLIASLVGYAAAAYFLSRSYFLPVFVFIALAGGVYSLAGQRTSLPKLNARCLLQRRLVWLYPAMTVSSIVLIYISILLLNRFG